MQSTTINIHKLPHCTVSSTRVTVPAAGFAIEFEPFSASLTHFLNHFQPFWTIFWTILNHCVWGPHQLKGSQDGNLCQAQRQQGRGPQQGVRVPSLIQFPEERRGHWTGGLCDGHTSSIVSSSFRVYSIWFLPFPYPFPYPFHHFPPLHPSQWFSLVLGTMEISWSRFWAHGVQFWLQDSWLTKYIQCTRVASMLASSGAFTRRCCHPSWIWWVQGQTKLHSP